MNNILQLKGTFSHKSSSGVPGPSNIPKGKSVSIQHLKKLKSNLKSVQHFWENEVLRINPLVSVYYRDVIAKSNRLKGTFGNGNIKNNESIVGAKFTAQGAKKHIITHCVNGKTLAEAIKLLEEVIAIVSDNFGDEITCGHIEDINGNKYRNIFNGRKTSTISKTRFVNIIVDAYYVEKFGLETAVEEIQENAIVTIYDTGVETTEIMKQLGIDVLPIRLIDKTTLLLTPDQYRLLRDKASYLISMAVSDLAELVKVEQVEQVKGIDGVLSIPNPGNEPTVGVIDTMFAENVYFSQWVDFHNMLDPAIPLLLEDYVHGTMVDSIIVDGPSLNPTLDDGCGRFKVRHFGVACKGKMSSFTVLRAIKEIVISNRDIKVWNLSLGSVLEINPNFISPEAAILDRIQYENDVIFIVAGTNKNKEKDKDKDKDKDDIQKIGAPADSINSIVVNSVDPEGKPADYCREGLVLSFFNKPDVSYYGGVAENNIQVYAPHGVVGETGTSFAAPWITRKVAYLIEVLGLSRELAKALLIDAAAGWSRATYCSRLIGHGVVPIRIEDIVATPDDEIKFLIEGVSEQYETFHHRIPIPEENEKQPFVSKATLCYFPKCSRNQGVDYTNTEMDIHFGRLSDTKKGGKKINTINDNKQSDEDGGILYEGNARKLYRKWDNVKCIRENVKTPKGAVKQPKKKSGNGLWGLSIRTKERLNAKDGEHIRFGVVVTLKEVGGKNRIGEFIEQCWAKGWVVSKINIENRIDIYNRAEEEIELE